MSFQKELTELINRHSKENESNTPDYILAEYVRMCLEAFAMTTKDRDAWFGFKPFQRLSEGIAPPKGRASWRG